MGKDGLYDAAIAGDTDAIAKLDIEADKLDDFGNTVLHWESKRGNAERVRFILRELANKNLLVKLSADKISALQLAAHYGHTEVVEVFLDAARHLPSSSSSSSATDKTHDSPITSFRAFLRHADPYMDTALHYAVKEGNLVTAKLLVEAINTRS